MAGHCCCLPMKVNVLSKQRGGTVGSPPGAHALEGRQSHTAVLRKHRFWQQNPSRTSTHPSIDLTPQPTHPGRTNAASQGLESRKRARKEVTFPIPWCHHPGETSPQAVGVHGSSTSSSSQLPGSPGLLSSNQTSFLQGAPCPPTPEGMGLHQEGWTRTSGWCQRGLNKHN